MAILEGGHSSYIQKPRAIRVKFVCVLKNFAPSVFIYMDMNIWIFDLQQQNFTGQHMLASFTFQPLTYRVQVKHKVKTKAFLNHKQHYSPLVALIQSKTQTRLKGKQQVVNRVKMTSYLWCDKK